jgi:endonuclease YncB( thermonuclease family)
MLALRPSLLAMSAAVLAGAVLSACAGASTAGDGPPATSGQRAESSQGSASGQRAEGALSPQGETVGGLVIDRVVDGDTVKVELDGEYVSVRLIGMNTPETVKPDSPVECFGPESSEFAKQALTGAQVTLEFDDSQGRTDQYDRVLAYVWREQSDGSLSLFNLESISGGYAFERQYGSTPYAWKDEFVRAQQQAQDADAGLWGACPVS